MAASTFEPPDQGLCDDRLLARGPLNAPAWVYANINGQALARLRQDPEVFIRRDWHAREAVRRIAVVCECL